MDPTTSPAPDDSTRADARPVLVAVAWPYAQGSLHLGHLAGAYLPADIFARYHRIAGNDVLMVSGSDAHGTPITVKAEEEGVSPAEIVERYHAEFLRYWDELGIAFDLFTTTMTDNHRAVVHDVFLRHLENGYLERRVTNQFYDPVAERFLPDRYVEGTCPHCGYEGARGDQCDNCGRTLDPEELIDPRSRLTGATPELRPTEHFFFLLSRFEQPLLEWLETREGWRPHVLNWAIGFVKDGLQDRAITRDLDWGIEVPVPDLGEGKRIYVWYEAVIGYLSASKEWAQRQGDPEAWRRWWEDPAAETFYFIGKDNIPFHAVFWPAMLMGYGGLNLPTNVPANQYVTFKGQKASKSRGIGRTVLDYLDTFEPDALRFALAANLPEHSDTDLTDADLVRRVNEELVATWGNLVHRVLSMTHRNFGAVPEPGDLDARDEAVLARVDAALAEAARQIEAVELRAGLRAALEGAQAVNVYLNELEPWKTAKTDRDRTATTLWTALQAIGGLTVAFAPYLPFTSARLRGALGLPPEATGAGWRRPEIAVGTEVGRPEPLFRKIEIDEAAGEPDTA